MKTRKPFIYDYIWQAVVEYHSHLFTTYDVICETGKSFVSKHRLPNLLFICNMKPRISLCLPSEKTHYHNISWHHRITVTSYGHHGVSNHRASAVYSTICQGAHERKHQNYALLAFVRGLHRWTVDSPHKGPGTQKMFPFDDVIMKSRTLKIWLQSCLIMLKSEPFTLRHTCTQIIHAW